MNEAEIRKYAELMRELDLTGLEVTENGCVVRLERTPAAPVLPRETVAVPPAPPVPAAAPQEGTTEVIGCASLIRPTGEDIVGPVNVVPSGKISSE